jgi:hypothetical protein
MPELVPGIHRANLANFFIEFTELQFTVAGLYWVDLPTNIPSFLKSVLSLFGGELGCFSFVWLFRKNAGMSKKTVD